MDGAPPPAPTGRPAIWSLAIDFGTTASVAAVDDGTHVRLASFGASTRLPSGVFVEDDGTLVAGTVAANRGGAAPARYVRTPKRHVGRDREVVVGGRTIDVAELVAAVLRDILTRVVPQMGGVAPARVVMTHPARWGSAGKHVLAEAATRAGLGIVDLVPEPVAAGHGLAPAPGEGTIAVYDLGGGTLDTAVLRAAGGRWTIAGPPGGVDPLGGETFDAHVHHHLIEHAGRLDPAAAARVASPSGSAERGYARTWWRDLRSLKEDLSETVSGHIAVPGTDHTVMLTRDELEQLVADAVSRSVAELSHTIWAAEVVDGGLGRIVLSGDAARMPLVDRLVRERFPDVEVRSADDPKGVVSMGALAMGRAEVSLPEVSLPEPGPPPSTPASDGPPSPPPDTERPVLPDPPPPPPPDPPGGSGERLRPGPVPRPRRRAVAIVTAAVVVIVAVVGAVAAAGSGGGDPPPTTPTTPTTPTAPSTSTTTTSTTTPPGGSGDVPPAAIEAIEAHMQDWATLDDCQPSTDLPAGATALYECNADVSTDESFEFGWLAFDGISSLDDYMDGMGSEVTVIETGAWQLGGADVGTFVLYDEGDGSGGMIWSFDDDHVVGYLVSDLGHERADELWAEDGNAGQG